jgi:hypothetical protein
VSARDHWYRDDDWDDATRAEFFRRLSRARPHNRDQYKRIKASYLLGSSNADRQADGRRLMEELVKDPETSDFQRTTALSQLGMHRHAIGDLVAAEALLRAALAIGGPDASGLSMEEEIAPAEILLARGSDESLAEAESLLERRSSDPPVFVSSQFRLAVAVTRLLLVKGESIAARDWARDALELAGRTRSDFAHHPTVGLVNASVETLAWLEEVVAGNSPTSSWRFWRRPD